MSLSVGIRLGPYEILSLLGAGGMGEVYRAKDTSLSRDVAIKVLPVEVGADPERLARFKREAQLLAALNHPNIAAIYGLDQANGKPFLVLELVEGEELAQRLKRGPVPLDEALPIAKQVAEALEEAHEHGIVHRDLKPANIKLTLDGKVKVLDFGLARAYSGEGEGTSTTDVSHSPTRTGGTELGVILGTAAYMSPEQGRGKRVDRRADIWAFGVVLFEMLTGKRLFGGETNSDTLAAVLTREPDWRALPATVPAGVQTLLHACLVRDPKQRLRDIGEARRALERTGATEPAAMGVAPPSWLRVLPWALAAIGLAFGARSLWTPLPAPARPLRLSLEVGADVSLDVSDAGSAAILSPDGSLLVFVGRVNVAERPQLFLRRLDQLTAAPLPGTQGARTPFFSPDGQWVAFFADGQLKRIAVNGGAAVVLANAPAPRGGTWSEDGTIFFTPGSLGVGLSRVSSSGGATEVLTRPDPAAGEATHRWPQALPGAKAVLFTAHDRVGGYEDASIVVQRLPGGPKKVIVRGGYHGRYLASGHIVYMHEGTLFAIPFDLARLEAAGTAVPVIQDVIGSPFTAGAEFAFSERGTLVYLPGRGASAMRSIHWLDRTGKLSLLRPVPGTYRSPRWSPDGTKLSIDVFDGHGANIWVCEWGRDTISKLTFDATGGAYPVWAPDGRGIAFTSLRGDQRGNIYWQRADGTGSAQPLTRSKNNQIPTSWHPSGKYLAFLEFNQQKTGFDVMVLPIEGDEVSGLKPGTPFPFVHSAFNEGQAAFSPDGRWLAYSSNDSGRVEVYVRPFPGPGGKWQISSEGGSFPTWSRNGRELLYETIDQRLMAVSYAEHAGAFDADKPRLWGEVRLPDLPGFRTFDMHPDGQRLAVLKGVQEPGEKQNKVVLFQNFFDELRRVAPSK
jgi:serine/threonine-protein kinase